MANTITSHVRFGDVDDLNNIEHDGEQTAHTETKAGKKDDNVYRRFGKKSKLATAIAHSIDRIFHSDVNENKKVKALLGIIAGVIFGCLLFLFFRFSFGYTFFQSSIIAASATVVLCIGLALFTMCRCVVALMFPNMFTQKGRAVLLSIIFGILINYQVSNITYNARVTGDSMSCVVELAAEQAREIQTQLAVPVQDMAKYIKRQVAELKQATEGVQDAINKADEAMKTMDRALNEAKTFVSNLVQNCNNQLKPVRDACNTVCRVPFSISCDVCRKIGCDGLAVINQGITSISNTARGAVDNVLQYINVDIEIKTDMSGSTSTTANATAVREKVNAEIGSKTEVIELTLEIMKKVLSVSLVLVLMQAYWYLRNYLAKDGYDNIYITSQFRKLDQEQSSSGGEQLLPLKKKEKKSYVDTHSLRLNSIELAHCEISLVQVGLHFLVFLLLTMFDYALYYILSLIQRYGSVNVTVEGHGRFEIDIKGNGPVSKFYRIMIKNLNREHTMSSSLDVDGCLPNPREPNLRIVPGILGLYVVAVIMVLLRGYGMRLRRKISAYYYPQQEEVRIEFLHKKIRHKRISFLKFLRQQVKSSHKENSVKEQMQFSTWLSFKCPILARCLPKRLKLACTCCEQKDSRLNQVTLTPCSGTLGGVRCDAIYCQECWSSLKNECPLCSMKNVAIRD